MHLLARMFAPARIIIRQKIKEIRKSERMTERKILKNK